MLKDRLAKIPNVFTLQGPVLAVRPFCGNANYWQVYFDTNRMIRDAFSPARFPVPEQHFRVQSPAN